MPDHVGQEVNGSVGGSFYSNVAIKHPIVGLMRAALRQRRSTVTSGKSNYSSSGKVQQARQLSPRNILDSYLESEEAVNVHTEGVPVLHSSASVLHRADAEVRLVLLRGAGEAGEGLRPLLTHLQDSVLQ